MIEIKCPICEGEGFTVEVEGECCLNYDYINQYGSCCGIPNPVQVQKKCDCNNGVILIEEP